MAPTFPPKLFFFNRPLHLEIRECFDLDTKRGPNPHRSLSLDKPLSLTSPRALSLDKPHRHRSLSPSPLSLTVTALSSLSRHHSLLSLSSPLSLSLTVAALCSLSLSQLSVLTLSVSNSSLRPGIQFPIRLEPSR
ncbi:hypothetical protein Syun_016688 [Stephania yunnanensis]|uniref:Uncharacterized protein n=1 Tax=Stephania yunnanensis TaxID=152371 RepID=A0AAP0J7X1_9MAGN